MHAVERLRQQLIAQSTKPFLARGYRLKRCAECLLAERFCLCPWRPQVASDAAFCLLMHADEPLKPTNTGRLMAELWPEQTQAFVWSRTEENPPLLALLADPQWQPYVVFPAEFAPQAEIVEHLAQYQGAQAASRKPLFILLDATWPQARKIFRKSPYLQGLPILSLNPDKPSAYRLRRSNREEHLCTAEVAVLCLEQAGEQPAAEALAAYFEIFSSRYLAARLNLTVDESAPPYQVLKRFLPAADGA
ncbi:tRNA-uridine aminocarboxypropyltransferase [Atopomonas sediminilitoris]|uniref:tRNA-uridine aminocarboxypropyltransferase n=1 Tax=Atopomonas sediminilitoris TaxID=2919919 RepID=UPI0035227AB3